MRATKLDPPFRTLNSYLKERFGQRVQKIPIDAGLTCPNRDGTKGRGGCIYCDPNGSGTGASRQGVSIRQQMRSGMTWAKRRYKAKLFIAYFQAFSNTYGAPERLYGLYKEALFSPDIVGLFIATRPDCIDDERLDAIEAASQGRYVTIELGLQSANNATLRRINRGHSVEDFVASVERIKKRGMEVCAHVIFGLPGESETDMMATVDLLAQLGVTGVKFHELYVVKGTPLHAEYEKGAVKILSLEEYACLVAQAIKRLPNVVVHRLQADPPRTGLIAPEWSLKKHLVRNIIIQEILR